MAKKKTMPWDEYMDKGFVALLVSVGRSTAELAEEYGVTEETILELVQEVNEAAEGMNALLEDMRNEETCYDRIVRASSKEAFYERNKIESEYMYFGSPDRKYFGVLLWEWRSKIKNYKNPRDYNAIIQDWITFVYNGKCYDIDTSTLKTSSETLEVASDDIIKDLKKIKGVTAVEFFFLYD